MMTTIHLSVRRGLWAAAALALTSAVLVGCDRGPKYVPVSGVIKLNGKPYGEAVVSFQPIATEGNDSPGSGSTSYTDAEGRYKLKSADGHDGAVIGKHRVMIMSKGNQPTIDYATETSPDSSAALPKQKPDPIPRSWNVDSDKVFEVPAGGSKNADFDIPTSARP